jgi:hypothetical protein
LLNVLRAWSPATGSAYDASCANHTALWSVDGREDNLVRDSARGTISRLQSCGRETALEQLWLEEAGA